MPTAARRERERHNMHHKVTGVREGWKADSAAVAALLRALGYPAYPPHPIAAPEAGK